MRQRWSLVLASFGFSALLLYFSPTPTQASMDEAGLNFALAKDEMSKLLDAAAQEKLRVFNEQNDKFRKYGELVQYQVEQLGKNLHEKERRWIDETAKEKVLAKYSRIQADIATVRQQLGDGKPADVSALKGDWNEMSDAFDKLWDDYLKRGKQLAEAQKEVDERVKLFKEDCKKCF